MKHGESIDAHISVSNHWLKAKLNQSILSLTKRLNEIFHQQHQYLDIILFIVNTGKCKTKRERERERDHPYEFASNTVPGIRDPSQNGSIVF